MRWRRRGGGRGDWGDKARRVYACLFLLYFLSISVYFFFFFLFIILFLLITDVINELVMLAVCLVT